MIFGGKIEMTNLAGNGIKFYFGGKSRMKKIGGKCRDNKFGGKSRMTNLAGNLNIIVFQGAADQMWATLPDDWKKVWSQGSQGIRQNSLITG